MGNPFSSCFECQDEQDKKPKHKDTSSRPSQKPNDKWENQPPQIKNQVNEFKKYITKSVVDPQSEKKNNQSSNLKSSLDKKDQNSKENNQDDYVDEDNLSEFNHHLENQQFSQNNIQRSFQSNKQTIITPSKKNLNLKSSIDKKDQNSKENNQDDYVDEENLSEFNHHLENQQFSQNNIQRSFQSNKQTIITPSKKNLDPQQEKRINQNPDLKDSQFKKADIQKVDDHADYVDEDNLSELSHRSQDLQLNLNETERELLSYGQFSMVKQIHQFRECSSQSTTSTLLGKTHISASLNSHQQQPNHQNFHKIIHSTPQQIPVHKDEGVLTPQNYKNNSQQKKPLGLNNLGNTCYINSALQALRQMYQLQNEFFNENDSEFALKLKFFFDKLNQGTLDTEALSQFVRTSKQKQIHNSGGGDSYQTLISFLGIIIEQCNSNRKAVPGEQLTSFQRYVTTLQLDGVSCKNCQNFCEDEASEFCKIYEPVTGLFAKSFEKMFTLESYFDYIEQVKLNCPTCQRNTAFIPRRIMVYFPNFLIVKFEKTYKIRENQSTCMSISTDYKNTSYKLIGYCNYYGHHYSYTAFYQQQWLDFSDSYVSPQNFDLRNAIYLIYQRVN